MGGRAESPGQKLPGSFQNLPLVVWMEIRVEKADRQRLDPLPSQRVKNLVYLRQIQGDPHAAIGHHPLGHLSPVRPRDQGIWFSGVEIVEGRAPLAGDLQQIPEPTGGNERGLCPSALEQRVGGDRGAVGEVCDLAR